MSWGLIEAGPGGDDLTPFIVTDPSGSTIGGGAWPSANLGIWCKLRVGRPRRANGLLICNGAPSGNGKGGLYVSDGTTLTELAMSASTPLAGANAGQQLAFGAAADLFPFIDYLAFLAVDNNTATFLRYTIGAAAIALDLGLTYSLANAFASPPASQAISGLSGPASGYTPILAIY